MCIVIFSNPLYVPPLHVGHKSLLVGTRNLNLITKTNREVLSKAKLPVTTYSCYAVSRFTILLLISQ